jgi:protein TonB
MIVTLSVSLGLHAAAVVAVLLLLHAAVPVADTPDKPTEVELVMEERKGDLSPTASPSPSPPAPDATRPERERSAPQEAQAAAPPPVEAQPNTSDATATVEAQPDAPEETAAPARQSEPASAAVEAPVQEAKPEPAPPPAQTAPTISLAGTDSPSNARAFGAHIIPASPSAVFHNRPPVYPQEAAQNGEHGTVVVLIHISPAGSAAGVDLLRSSGYVLLDRAARDAVLRWRFLPAVKDGQSVASDLTMGFEFDNE